MTLYGYSDENCTQVIGRSVVAGDDCALLELDGLTTYYSPGACVLPERVSTTRNRVIPTAQIETTSRTTTVTTSVTTSLTSSLTSTAESPDLDSDGTIDMACSIAFVLVTITVLNL